MLGNGLYVLGNGQHMLGNGWYVLGNGQHMLGNGLYVLGNGPHACIQFMKRGYSYYIWGGKAGSFVYLEPIGFSQVIGVR